MFRSVWKSPFASIDLSKVRPGQVVMPDGREIKPSATGLDGVTSILEGLSPRKQPLDRFLASQDQASGLLREVPNDPGGRNRERRAGRIAPRSECMAG